MMHEYSFYKYRGLKQLRLSSVFEHEALSFVKSRRFFATDPNFARIVHRCYHCMYNQNNNRQVYYKEHLRMHSHHLHSNQN